MKKDRYYVEELLKNYKRNKARVEILQLHKLDDNDNELSGIDYSSISVQTSNLSTLDNMIIKREQELKKLKKDITITEILLNSLDSRKDCQYKKLIENYYIENKTKNETMHELGLYDDSNFFRLCRIVINSLVKLLEG